MVFTCIEGQSHINFRVQNRVDIRTKHEAKIIIFDKITIARGKGKALIVRKEKKVVRVKIEEVTIVKGQKVRVIKEERTIDKTRQIGKLT